MTLKAEHLVVMTDNAIKNLWKERGVSSELVVQYADQYKEAIEMILLENAQLKKALKEVDDEEVINYLS